MHRSDKGQGRAWMLDWMCKSKRTFPHHHPEPHARIPWLNNDERGFTLGPFDVCMVHKSGFMPLTALVRIGMTGLTLIARTLGMSGRVIPGSERVRVLPCSPAHKRSSRQCCPKGSAAPAFRAPPPSASEPSQTLPVLEPLPARGSASDGAATTLACRVGQRVHTKPQVQAGHPA
eukprot:scaffold4944_cov135-Isochrysis_galbana.AAC.11